ncbi:hypothetical protein CLAIMM_05294 [Cladophialophora immunda]|nr:hypothetical protein CLAIMM_05294 [Cladophialophora immunda]
MRQTMCKLFEAISVTGKSRRQDQLTNRIKQATPRCSRPRATQVSGDAAADHEPGIGETEGSLHAAALPMNGRTSG